MNVTIISFEDDFAICSSKDRMFYTTVKKELLDGYNEGDTVDIDDIKAKAKKTSTRKIYFDDIEVEVFDDIE